MAMGRQLAEELAEIRRAGGNVSTEWTMDFLRKQVRQRDVLLSHIGARLGCGDPADIIRALDRLLDKMRRRGHDV